MFQTRICTFGNEETARFSVENIALCGKLRTHNEGFVPLTVLFVPFDELGNTLADITARLVADQLVGFRDIGVSVFGVAIVGPGILDIECRIDLVADELRGCGDVIFVLQNLSLARLYFYFAKGIYRSILNNAICLKTTQQSSRH